MKNAYATEIRRWDIPIRRLDDSMNPFMNSKVVFWVLCGFQSGNYVTMKAGMVHRLIMSAKKAGITKDLVGYIESTSGATGLVLSQLVRHSQYGTPNTRLRLVVNKCVPDGKRLPLVYAGATVIEPLEGMSAIATARHLGGGGWSQEKWQPSEDGWLNLDQYANPANLMAYQQVVAPQILRKTKKMKVRLGLISGGIGTGGTTGGLSILRQKRISLVGAMSVQGEKISGLRGEDEMSEIRFPWKESVDRIFKIQSLHAHIAALQIQDQTGMMMGISSGAAYIATLLALKEHETNKTLDSLRSETDGYVHVMFVAHDGLRTYTANSMPILDKCPDWRQKKVWERLW